jgi:hypothetical protein
MKTSEANAILPAKPTQSLIDPSNLVVLLIAEPKWGKTKFFMSNPNALLLAFEEGHKFQRGHKVIIDKWHQKRGVFQIKNDKEGCPHMTAMQALETIEASDRFDFVIIDTVDMAVRMCVEYECGIRGKEHPSDAGDYGKGWDVTQNAPMRKFILRLLKTGRGVGMITHSKTEISRFTTGEKARKEATIPGGVMKFCTTQADVIMHGELGKKQSDKRLRDRILVCEGDMDTLAGNRSGTMLPDRYIVSPENPWRQFKRFFTSSTAADKAMLEYKTAMKGKK